MLLLLAAAARLPGQTEGLRPEAVAQLCRAPENTGNEAVMVRVIDARLHPYANGSRRIHLAVVDNGEFEYHDAANFGLICVPKAAVNFFADAEGELAFLIANEVGHLLDDTCRTAAGRRSVAHSISDAAQQNACEMRADDIAFTMICRSGYNPASAAGALGRLLMFQGTHRPGDSVGAMTAYSAAAEGHPVTPERIEHVRKLVAKAIAATQ